MGIDDTAPAAWLDGPRETGGRADRDVSPAGSGRTPSRSRGPWLATAVAVWVAAFLGGVAAAPFVGDGTATRTTPTEAAVRRATTTTTTPGADHAEPAPSSMTTASPSVAPATAPPATAPPTTRPAPAPAPPPPAATHGPPGEAHGQGQGNGSQPEEGPDAGGRGRSGDGDDGDDAND